VVDFLRTTYSSRFYYSRNPDQYIVASYRYASEDAEFLQLPGFYGSGVWLDPWDVQMGLGDSLEDYERVAGEPLDANVLSTKKSVLPLRTNCPGSRETAMAMTAEIFKGLPAVCWRVKDLPPPSMRYRVTFINVVDTSRPDLPSQTKTLDLDIVPFSPWNWLGSGTGYSESIISDEIDSPTPENSKAFLRVDYPDILYSTELFVSIVLWWDGLFILHPTATPVEATIHVTVGQLLIERIP